MCTVFHNVPTTGAIVNQEFVIIYEIWYLTIIPNKVIKQISDISASLQVQRPKVLAIYSYEDTFCIKSAQGTPLPWSAITDYLFKSI